MDTVTVVKLLCVGLAAGVLAGTLGLGGGVLVVPALVFILHLSQQQAQGASLGMMALPIFWLAAWRYHSAGNLDWRISLLMAPGFVLGGLAGAQLANMLPQDVLKRVFAIFLVFTAGNMLFLKDSDLLRTIKAVALGLVVGGVYWALRRLNANFERRLTMFDAYAAQKAGVSPGNSAAE